MAIQTITTFELKDGLFPNIDGLAFRGFQGDHDYPIMLEIFQAMQEADKIEQSFSLEELTNSYNNIQRCNLYTDMIFAEVGDEPVGYGRCFWNPEVNGDYVYILFVNLKPEWRGSGIGLAMVKHLQARIREIARRHPVEVDKYIQMAASNHQPWQAQLTIDQGLTPVRYSILMTRPCSLPIKPTPLPRGLELRPPRTDQLRQVWDACHDAFRDHFGAVEPTEAEFQNWLMDPEFQPHLWKIAWDGDHPVGNVLNYVLHAENEAYQRKRGYTEGISVIRPWRRQGVARSLLTHSIRMFQEMGMDETCLGVDTENPNGALELYQSVGYREIQRYVTYRKDLH
jgi:ribosomal protein S18 acetylase RimI-like enzyme